MSNIFNAIKLFEEEQQAQTNASTYMQVKTLVDKMDKGGKKRVADALKKSLKNSFLNDFTYNFLQ